MPTTPPPHAHAVSRLRSLRLQRSTRPFMARGGPHGERCAGCRLLPTYCICALRPIVPTRAAICLLMSDTEPLKPSNTGWLIADVIPDTFAFAWARTEVDPALLSLLADPQWQPYVVFPGEFVDPVRVVDRLQETEMVEVDSVRIAKRPLFILLDATWSEARKIFKKSPYLLPFPVLSLQPEQISNYQLRRSRRDDHFCTAEVAALCMELAQERQAAETLDAYLALYTEHYLRAKLQQKLDLEDALHQRIYALMQR
ncbi:tRNA-uridine aminocarboxypropyltransferase [Undibacterium cyanobacteriorum]|uniref:tRNA-uridine aminocarboxypropyltransferase n=1 Tax=Undibacterium cyanobacteriorum TaxID=3073561 RepID=A0ABY9RIM2_9BURK|nr:tRNA-uridine aminocarboxypropyltransferase [Undibacterium sp. 20NA77.5]WMW80791.1 tRNA-uridine aminocarboxypropyltransferase [Undibacterium sp. 20NA77.5]